MNTLEQILSQTKELRIKHEKRSEARNYASSYSNQIKFPSSSATHKISLGYFERLLLKLCNEKADNGEEECTLALLEWSEGCGVFEGKYKISKGTQNVREGSFSWAGVGNIEESWDLFSEFT